MRTWPPLAALVATLAASLAGCMTPSITQTDREAPPQVMESSLRYQKAYVLAPGDQVDVVVWRTPEASRTVVVRSDGLISLPLLQDVPAAGLTAKELADKLTAQFGQRLLNPQVNVVPVLVRQPMVYVLGDVGTPQAVPLRNAATALQALAAAGGARRSGNEGDVSVIRLMDNGHLRAIAVQAPMDGQVSPYMSLAAMPLQADDIVFVPETGRSQVSRLLDDFVFKPLQTILTFKLVRQY